MKEKAVAGDSGSHDEVGYTRSAVQSSVYCSHPFSNNSLMLSMPDIFLSFHIIVGVFPPLNVAFNRTASELLAKSTSLKTISLLSSSLIAS